MKTLTTLAVLTLMLGLAGLALAKAPAVIKGVVKEVNADAKKITVTVKKAGVSEDVVVLTNDATKFVKDGQPAAFSDLKAKMRVTISPAGANETTPAERVEIMVPKPKTDGGAGAGDQPKADQPK